MSRPNRGVHGLKKKKKIFKLAKGYQGRGNNCLRIAKQRVEKGLQYAYRDRRNKKRDFRGLWIQRINAAARMNGLTYSTFMGGIKAAGIDLDRKVMAEIAMHDAAAFTALADQARDALEKKAA